MKFSGFICPVCGSFLTYSVVSYRCENNHSFDKAKKGYVNLLQNQGSKNKRHGDDLEMLKARESFLSAGFYEPLRNKIAGLISGFDFANREITLADIGCGEGYYTSYIATYLAEKNPVSVFGIDISKDALALMHKRLPEANLAVASMTKLPFAEGSVDVLMNIFAPYSAGEFSRVLSSDGIFVKVIPLERHLFELKAAVYDEPYENKVDYGTPVGFEKISFDKVEYKMNLSGQSLIDLFKMTPYYYKTGIGDQNKITQATQLEISAEFGIGIYRKS